MVPGNSSRLVSSPGNSSRLRLFPGSRRGSDGSRELLEAGLSPGSRRGSDGSRELLEAGLVSPGNSSRLRLFPGSRRGSVSPRELLEAGLFTRELLEAPIVPGNSSRLRWFPGSRRGSDGSRETAKAPFLHPGSERSERGSRLSPRGASRLAIFGFSRGARISGSSIGGLIVPRSCEANAVPDRKPDRGPDLISERNASPGSALSGSRKAILYGGSAPHKTLFGGRTPAEAP
jgi:hypothetical protein